MTESGVVVRQEGSSDFSDIDPAILQEARKQHSPYDRMMFFNGVYNQILDKANPRLGTIEQRLAQSQDSRIDVNGVRAAYVSLFGREIGDDVPNIEAVYTKTMERHGSTFISEWDMNIILEKGVDFASQEQDPPQIEPTTSS